MRRSPLVPICLALAVLAGCTSAPNRWTDPSSAPVPSAAGSSAATQDPAALAARLSDVDLVGQLLVPYAYGDSATKVSAGSALGNRKIGGVSTPAELIAKYHLGGLILVSFSADDPTGDTNPTSNIESVTQVRGLTTGLQAAALKLPDGLPLLIGTDQEYGAVTRLKSGVVQLPSGMAVGAAHSPTLTQSAWAAAGLDLAAVGLNVDFAPDSDVLGPGGNGVIGSRSFGQDPAAVASQVAAAVRGLQGSGVAATLKHFPGHGHTTTDSHTNLPVLHQSRAALDAGDLPPFAAGIAAGVGLIMSGHLDVRAIDPGVAASFSSKVLIDLLRKKMGFKGVVITDALNMAPAEKYPPGEAAVRAVLAGNDMLLMPPDLGAAQQGLLAAVKSGRLPRARLLEAVTRILTLKQHLATGPKPGPLSTVDGPDRQRAAAAVTAAAVTVLRGRCSGPLVQGPVTVTTAAGRATQRAWLSDALRADGITVTDTGGTVVHLVGYGDTSADLSARASITVAMDTPYVLRHATSAVRLATFSSTHAAMNALAAVLAGRARATGRSPVDVPGLPRTAC